MNPFEMIELKKDSFTKKEMIVYNILQKNPDLILRGSITSLAKEYEVSQSTITRFCQKIGYDGFNEFKFDVFRYEKQGKDSETNHSQTTIDAYCQLLHILEENLDKELMDKLSKDIIKANRIFICGLHKSSLPAKMLQYNLFKINKTAIYLSWDESHDLSQMIGKDDMLIIFTNSGSLASSMDLKEIKIKSKPNITMITMNNNSKYKKICNHYIWLPSSSNQKFSIYLENQIVFFIYVDLLTSSFTKLI